MSEKVSYSKDDPPDQHTAKARTGVGDAILGHVPEKGKQFGGKKGRRVLTKSE